MGCYTCGVGNSVCAFKIILSVYYIAYISCWKKDLKSLQKYAHKDNLIRGRFKNKREMDKNEKKVYDDVNLSPGLRPSIEICWQTGEEIYQFESSLSRN